MSKTASKKVTIENSLGLHARPAMLFVETAAKCAADITVCRTDNSKNVDGKSILEMMMLAATRGTEIEICAKGEDAEQAVARLVELVKSNFNEQ